MRAVVVCCQSLVLALVLSWPASTSLPAGTVVGAPGGDAAKHVWNLWWAREELWRGRGEPLTYLINFPDGVGLHPIEPVHQLLAAAWPFDVVALANVLAVANVFLVGVAAAGLGWVVTRRVAPSLVAGALAQMSSFVAFTLHVGVGELRQVWWIPLGLTAAVLAQKRGGDAPHAWVGLLAAVATISCFYHGFFLSAALAAFALATWGRVEPTAWSELPAASSPRRWAVVFGTLVVLALPAALMFARSYGAPDDEAPIGLDEGASATLAELVWPGAREGAYGGGRYLGLVTLLLAGAGLAADRRAAAPWAAVAGAGAVLALGPWLDLGWLRVPLPFAAVNAVLALAAEPMNFPSRFLVLPAIALPVLAAIAVTRWRVLGWLAPLALVEALTLHDVPWPRRTTTLADFSALRPPEGAVADLSHVTRGNGTRPDAIGPTGASIVNWANSETRTMAIAAQITLGRPFSTVPVDRLDLWASSSLLWTAALPLSGALAGYNIANEEIRESVFLLGEAGFGSVFVSRPCGTRRGPNTEVLDRHLGPPTSAPCGELWPVPVVPATEEQASLWRERHRERVARLAPPKLLRMVANAPALANSP